MSPYLPDPHPRLPDERARLRAAGRAAGDGGLPAGPRRRARRTSWCSTPAPSGRTRTTSCTAASGNLLPTKNATPGMQIAVGGCLAQKDKDDDPEARALGGRGLRYPQHRVAAGAAGAGPDRRRGPGRDQGGAGDVSRPTCPPGGTRRTRPGSRSAWAATTPAPSASCPALRGKETDRRPGDILAEIEALVAEGVQEVTLLGQNVNAYGVEFGDRHAFAELLRACGQIDGSGAGPVHLAASRRTSPTR